ESNCVFFEKIGSFAKAVKSKMPELVLADKNISSGGFDLKHFLREQKISSPVIFFNGFNADDKKRADFWYYQITPFIKKNGAGQYKRCIDFIFEKMQAGQISKEEDSNTFLYKIKERCKISEKPFELLKYLYKAEESVSIEKMRSDLLKDGSEYSANCLNVQLSRLKKLLAAEKDFKISLVKEIDGYRLVVF
nr:helix-turn-helix domain-containing protein [Treponema sp.]